MPTNQHTSEIIQSISRELLDYQECIAAGYDPGEMFRNAIDSIPEGVDPDVMERRYKEPHFDRERRNKRVS